MYYAVKKYFHHFKTGQTVDISTFIEGGVRLKLALHYYMYVKVASKTSYLPVR